MLHFGMTLIEILATCIHIYNNNYVLVQVPFKIYILHLAHLSLYICEVAMIFALYDLRIHAKF